MSLPIYGQDTLLFSLVGIDLGKSLALLLPPLLPFGASQLELGAYLSLDLYVFFYR